MSETVENRSEGVNYLDELRGNTGRTPRATAPRARKLPEGGKREKYYQMWIPRSVYHRIKAASLASGRCPADVLAEALDRLGVIRDAFAEGA